MNGFFSEYTGGTVSQQYRLYAKVLLMAVKSKCRIMRPYSVKAWAKHLSMLNSVDGIDDQRLETVLLWYCDHIGGSYIPEAYSGQGFRKKFITIEAAMLRASRREPATQDINITPEAHTVAKRLQGKGWPASIEKQLSVIVQQGMDAFRTFRKSLEKARGYTSYNKRLIPFLEYVIQKTRAHAHVFVEEWLIEINHKYRGWTEWNGSIKQCVFRPDHDMFTARGRGWAQHFAGKVSLWDELMQVLNDQR